MARMPQIPTPELGARPDSRVGRAESPDIGAITEPFQAGANATEHLAGQLEKFQQQKDAATAKIQKMADTVDITRKQGEFDLYAGDKLSGYITQATDTTIPPEQRIAFKDIPDLLRKDLQERTDSDVKATKSQEVALGLSEVYAHATNKHLLSAQSIAQQGIIQQAKNNLIAVGQNAVQTASKAATPGGLNAAIAQMKVDIGTNAPNLHADPASIVHKTGHDMVEGYVANGLLKNPVAVGEFLSASKGPHHDYLSGVEIAEGKKKAEHAFLAYGETQRFQLLKELSDSGARDYELKESGDLTPALAHSMNAADSAKKQAIQANPNISGEEKAKQTAMLDRGIQTRSWLSELPITPGRIDPKMKTEAGIKLREDFLALGKNWAKSPQDLDKVGQLRADLAEAEKNNSIPPTFAATVHTAITQMTGKSLGKEKGNTGWDLPLVGFKGTSRQFGNRYLDGQIESKVFGKLSADKQLEAFYNFHDKYNNAAKQIPDISNEAARTMAHEALMEAARRAPGAASGGK